MVSAALILLKGQTKADPLQDQDMAVHYFFTEALCLISVLEYFTADCFAIYFIHLYFIYFRSCRLNDPFRIGSVLLFVFVLSAFSLMKLWIHFFYLF